MVILDVLGSFTVNVVELAISSQIGVSSVITFDIAFSLVWKFAPHVQNKTYHTIRQQGCGNHAVQGRYFYAKLIYARL